MKVSLSLRSPCSATPTDDRDTCGASARDPLAGHGRERPIGSIFYVVRTMNSKFPAVCVAHSSVRTRRPVLTGRRGGRREYAAAATPAFQPLPRVDAALDFADLLELSLASVLPAFDRADFDGLEDLPMCTHPLSHCDQQSTGL